MVRICHQLVITLSWFVHRVVTKLLRNCHFKRKNLP